MDLSMLSAEGVRNMRSDYKSKTVEQLDEIREELVAEKLRISIALQDPEKLDRTRNGFTFYEYQAWRSGLTTSMRLIDYQLKVLRRIRAEKYDEEAGKNNGWLGLDPDADEE